MAEGGVRILRQASAVNDLSVKLRSAAEDGGEADADSVSKTVSKIVANFYTS